MTDMRTDLELMLIEHLDFDVPCEGQRTFASSGDWEPCGRLGEWIVTYKDHCSPGVIKTPVLCDECYENFLTGNCVCSTCQGVDDNVRDRIIRTERIKP